MDDLPELEAPIQIGPKPQEVTPKTRLDKLKEFLSKLGFFNKRKIMPAEKPEVSLTPVEKLNKPLSRQEPIPPGTGLWILVQKLNPPKDASLDITRPPSEENIAMAVSLTKLYPYYLDFINTVQGFGLVPEIRKILLDKFLEGDTDAIEGLALGFDKKLIEDYKESDSLVPVYEEPGRLKLLNDQLEFYIRQHNTKREAVDNNIRKQTVARSFLVSNTPNWIGFIKAISGSPPPPGGGKIIPFHPRGDQGKKAG